MKPENKKQYAVIGFVILIIVMSIILTKPASSPLPAEGTSLVSAAVFQERFESTPSAVLIDVRTPEEYAEGHIKGAINIDAQGEDFVAKLRELDKEVPYFVYCRSGGRSAIAVSAMKSEGIKSIVELEGGVMNAPSILDADFSPLK